ncbi:MAG: lysostaphin resistance A-like protein [Propionibacteriaceae bacterium]|nr:lysostaphin resistance A-like protein [Propionibacteriaceae bacterium]
MTELTGETQPVQSADFENQEAPLAPAQMEPLQPWVQPMPGQLQVQPKLFHPSALKDYMRFFQVPARPWWWAPIALVAAVAALFVVSFIVEMVHFFLEPGMWDIVIQYMETGVMSTTPGMFLANNILLAVCIPVAILFSWVFYKQGFGWLMSVVGRMRWRWLALVTGVLVLGYIVITALEFFVLADGQAAIQELQMQPYTWFMIATIILTTPFQAAAEEIVIRGFLGRILAALVPHRVLGLWVSALVTTAVFTLLHGSTDIWLNIFYVVFGFMAWWLVYRTGGLEASIAFHIVNNLFAEWTLPFSDFSDIFDRSSGAGDSSMLVSMGLQVALLFLIDYLARRRGLVRLSAPASALPVVVKPKSFVTPVGESTTTIATEDDLPRLHTTFRELLPAWAYHYEAGVPSSISQGFNSAGLPAMDPSLSAEFPLAHHPTGGLLTAERARRWEDLPENQPSSQPEDDRGDSTPSEPTNKDK